MGAMLYDTLLVVALLIAAGALVFTLRGGQPPPLNASWYTIYLAGVPFAFFTGFWTNAGQTLGMRSWRLCLIASDGGPVSFRRAVIRYFAAILSWAAFGMGFAWQLVDKDRLSWHDRLSATRLVYVGPQPRKPRIRSRRAGP